MNPTRFALNHVFTAALILASLMLTGCFSSGTFLVEDSATPVATTEATPPATPETPPPTTPETTPVAQAATGVIATNAGAEASSVGDVVSAVGSSIAATEMVGIDKGVMNGLGGAVQQPGTAIDILGTHSGNSLGQMGDQEADVLAIELKSVPLVVEQVGAAVSKVGDAVAAVDSGPTSALSSLTDPAGTLLNQTGAEVASLSDNMSTVMDSAIVQKVTRSGSTLIHMIAIDAEATTQSLGASTGLGVPANNLLVGTGLAINNLGDNISSSFAASPLLSSTGGVVSATGTLVVSVGGLVTPATSSNNPPSAFANGISSVISSSAPAPSMTPTPSLGGALSTVTTPVTSVLGSWR